MTSQVKGYGGALHFPYILLNCNNYNTGVFTSFSAMNRMNQQQATLQNHFTCEGLCPQGICGFHSHSELPQ